MCRLQVVRKHEKGLCGQPGQLAIQAKQNQVVPLHFRIRYTECADNLMPELKNLLIFA